MPKPTSTAAQGHRTHTHRLPSRPDAGDLHVDAQSVRDGWWPAGLAADVACKPKDLLLLAPTMPACHAFPHQPCSANAPPRRRPHHCRPLRRPPSRCHMGAATEGNMLPTPASPAMPAMPAMPLPAAGQSLHPSLAAGVWTVGGITLSAPSFSREEQARRGWQGTPGSQAAGAAASCSRHRQAAGCTGRAAGAAPLRGRAAYLARCRRRLRLRRLRVGVGLRGAGQSLRSAERTWACMMGGPGSPGRPQHAAHRMRFFLHCGHGTGWGVGASGEGGPVSSGPASSHGPLHRPRHAWRDGPERLRPLARRKAPHHSMSPQALPQGLLLPSGLALARIFASAVETETKEGRSGLESEPHAGRHAAKCGAGQAPSSRLTAPSSLCTPSACSPASPGRPAPPPRLLPPASPVCARFAPPSPAYQLRQAPRHHRARALPSPGLSAAARSQAAARAAAALQPSTRSLQQQRQRQPCPAAGMTGSSSL